jgi:hypothetical protein
MSYPFRTRFSLLPARFFLALLFNPEDGGDMLLEIVS